MTTNKQPCIYKIILQNKNARVAYGVSHGGISVVGKGRRRGGGDKANTGIGDGGRWRRRGHGRRSRLGRGFHEGRRELRRGGREHAAWSVGREHGRVCKTKKRNGTGSDVTLKSFMFDGLSVNYFRLLINKSLEINLLPWASRSRRKIY